MDALTAALIAFLSIAVGTAARIADRRLVSPGVRGVRVQPPQTRDGVSALPLASA